jgi:hypothetical protein
MCMNKGYVVPLTLVFLLVILAGVTLFGLKPNNSREVDDVKIQNIVNTIQNMDQQNTDATDVILDETNQGTETNDDTITEDTINIDTQEDASTGNETISNQICTDVSDCAPGQTCFIRPSDTKGYCF